MTLRRWIFPAMAALAFTACSGGEDAGELASGEAIDPIEAPAGQQWSETITESDAGGYVMGNPEAPIRLVEYMSLTCPHCRDFGETAFDEIRDQYVASGRVSFEIRNFVRDPIDLTAAMLTRCGADGSFFALTEAALGDQDALLTKAQELQQQGFFAGLEGTPPAQRPAALAEALGLIEMFQARGLSEDQQKACLSDEAGMTVLTEATAKASSEDNVQGTPSFFINGQPVDGTSWPIVRAKLQEAGAR